METTTAAAPARRHPGPLVLGALAAWAAAATAFVASGALAAAPRVVIPLVLLVPVALILGLFATRPAWRQAVAAWDPRWALWWHVVRAPVGVAFLVMEARGRLPGGFAIHAGWGDLAVGLLAIGAARCVPMTTRERRGFVLLFNVVGAADILAVIATAQYLLFLRPGSGLEALGTFPMGLLPTFVVPLVLIAHAITFLQLRAGRRRGHRRASDPR